MVKNSLKQSLDRIMKSMYKVTFALFLHITTNSYRITQDNYQACSDITVCNVMILCNSSENFHTFV